LREYNEDVPLQGVLVLEEEEDEQEVGKRALMM